MDKFTIPYDKVKDPRTTNESCWKALNDNLLPNPPFNVEHSKDEVFADRVEKNVVSTKIIMAHEFRENPDGFNSMAQAIADSYNDQHKLHVGGSLPIGFDNEEYTRREAGIPTGFDEER